MKLRLQMKSVCSRENRCWWRKSERLRAAELQVDSLQSGEMCVWAGEASCCFLFASCLLPVCFLLLHSASHSSSKETTLICCSRIQSMELQTWRNLNHRLCSVSKHNERHHIYIFLRAAICKASVFLVSTEKQPETISSLAPETISFPWGKKTPIRRNLLKETEKRVEEKRKWDDFTPESLKVLDERRCSSFPETEERVVTCSGSKTGELNKWLQILSADTRQT